MRRHGLVRLRPARPMTPDEFELRCNWYGATVNYLARWEEAFAHAGLKDTGPAEHPLQDRKLLKVVDTLLEKWQPGMLMVTLGGQGLLLAAPKRIDWARDQALPAGSGPEAQAQVLVLTDAVAQATVDRAVHALADHPAVAGPVVTLRVEWLEG